MRFKHTQIDARYCSLEELKGEINRLKGLSDAYNGIQYSIKIWINSIYGACASPFFVGYNINVAEAVTLQGQNMIHFVNGIIDHYFINIWHEDKELHTRMGIKANRILQKSLIVYNDTDSVYFSFDPVLKSSDWKGSSVDFILLIKDLRLNSYIKMRFEEYAKKFNTQDIQNLELEKISYSALMMAKKKYILDLAWKDPGISFKPQEKIAYTGVEIIQSSTPKFARKILKDLVKYVFNEGKNINYSEAVKKLRDYKKEFIFQKPDDISKSISIGDYEKYVREDKKEIILENKCPINVRSAAIYNHKVLSNKRWRGKYNLIKSGDKIKYYYSKDSDEVFGYLPGNFPHEFAPEIHYDLQFEKIIVEPFNRFLETLGFNPIPGNLIFARSLF